MPRKVTKSLKRVLPADRMYNSVLVTKMINKVMWDGKKRLAENLVYKAMEQASVKAKKEPMEVFEEAIKNVSPQVQVKSKRIGGANYQVPREVREDRRFMLALRWILDAANAKKGKAMRLKLADELMAAANNEGSAVKKKEDTHRMAESNKAFAHFAW